MSYSIDFWETPVPSTFAEATYNNSLVRRAARRVEPNPKFAQLAERLTAKFPCTMDPQEDASDEVWADGPVDGGGNLEWWGVNVLTQHAAAVRPFIVEEATALGLVAYDPQLGRAYLPNGAVLAHDSVPPQSSLSTKPWWKVW